MSTIRTVALLALLLFIGVPAASMGFSDAGSVQTIQDESITITTSNWSAVDQGTPPYLDTETVYYNGSVVEEANYTWTTSDGTIQATGGDLAANSPANATITYEYRSSSAWLTGAENALVVVFVVIAGLLVLAGAWFTMDAMGSYSGGGR